MLQHWDKVQKEDKYKEMIVHNFIAQNALNLVAIANFYTSLIIS